MGRGVGAGGGQSSLGYLFGSGAASDNPPPPQKVGQSSLGYLFGSGGASDNPPPAQKDSSAASQTVDSIKQQAAAGIRSNTTTNSFTNNYLRADGQHCGNFISDRPSTKVNAAPGGFSLGYLFGGENK